MKSIHITDKHELLLVDFKTKSLLMQKSEQASELRKVVEQGGVLVGDIIIKTDEGSIAKIVSTLAAIQNGMVATVDWKGKNGWIRDVGLEMMAVIATAVSQHIQTCFKVENSINTEMEALPEEELKNYDVREAWTRLGGP